MQARQQSGHKSPSNPSDKDILQFILLYQGTGPCSETPKLACNLCARFEACALDAVDKCLIQVDHLVFIGYWFCRIVRALRLHREGRRV